MIVLVWVFFVEQLFEQVVALYIMKLHPEFLFKDRFVQRFANGFSSKWVLSNCAIWCLALGFWTLWFLRFIKC